MGLIVPIMELLKETIEKLCKLCDNWLQYTTTFYNKIIFDRPDLKIFDYQSNPAALSNVGPAYRELHPWPLSIHPDT